MTHNINYNKSTVLIVEANKFEAYFSLCYEIKNNFYNCYIESKKKPRTIGLEYAASRKIWFCLLLSPTIFTIINLILLHFLKIF